MTARDAFGIPVPDEADDTFDFLKDPAPETPAPADNAEASAEAPAEPTAPEAPAASTEEPVAPTAEPTTEGPSADDATDAAPRMYAKRYDSIEKLEDGYQELRELHRRTAERAKEYEEQNRLVMQHAQEVESTLQQAVSALQQYQAQGQAPQLDEYGQPVPQPMPSPQQLQQFIDQQVQLRMQEAQSGWQEQASRDAEAQAARQSIYTFFEKHPEVEVNSTVDDDIKQTIVAINDAWSTWGTSMDITDPETIEVAYEATTRPALRHVLEKNPALVDDEQGMQLARFQASILEGKPITQAAQTVPASSPGAQVAGSPRPPTLERAATSSNSPDDRPLDEVDQAFLEYRKYKQRGGDSVFFGAPGKFE